MSEIVKPWMIVVVGLLLLWNVIAFVVTVKDKAVARRNGDLPEERRRRRTPEKRFLLFAGTLGGLGVLAGFYLARHKTKHYALLTGVWVLTVLSYGAAAALCYFLLR